MTQRVYEPDKDHPPGPQADLGPEAARGINYGNVGLHPERDNPRTAYDVKLAHRLLHEYRDDELKQLPILPEGTRLEPDAVYLDLTDTAAGEVRAAGHMEAKPGQLLVPKREVPYELWNRLRGVTDPARTNEGGTRGA